MIQKTPNQTNEANRTPTQKEAIRILKKKEQYDETK